MFSVNSNLNIIKLLNEEIVVVETNLLKKNLIFKNQNSYKTILIQELLLKSDQININQNQNNCCCIVIIIKSIDRGGGGGGSSSSSCSSRGVVGDNSIENFLCTCLDRGGGREEGLEEEEQGAAEGVKGRVKRIGEGGDIGSSSSSLLSSVNNNCRVDAVDDQKRRRKLPRIIILKNQYKKIDTTKLGIFKNSINTKKENGSTNPPPIIKQYQLLYKLIVINIIIIIIVIVINKIQNIMQLIKFNKYHQITVGWRMKPKPGD